MRRLAASVSIVVAKGEDGPVGMAATSITSLTTDPPAVLVCVNRATSLHALLVPTAPLSVNLLSRRQQDVSAAFGGGVPRGERFATGEWQTGPDGLPGIAYAEVVAPAVSGWRARSAEMLVQGFVKRAGRRRSFQR